MSELVLGIDTVGRGGAVALADASGVLGIRTHDPELGYAEELFGLFDALLADCGRTRPELTAVAVLSGPGSFTGLRIGVMTAKTIAFALDLPLLAAPTLDVLAASQGRGSRTAVVDAGGGHVWAAGFEGPRTGARTTSGRLVIWSGSARTALRPIWTWPRPACPTCTTSSSSGATGCRCRSVRPCWLNPRMPCPRSRSSVAVTPPAG